MICAESDHTEAMQDERIGTHLSRLQYVSTLPRSLHSSFLARDAASSLGRTLFGRPYFW